MAKTTKNAKTSKNDSTLIIRIPKKDRDAFIEICDAHDSSASRELRLYIKKFIKKKRADT